MSIFVKLRRSPKYSKEWQVWAESAHHEQRLEKTHVSSVIPA